MLDFELNANLRRLTISTNSEDLDAVVEALNETIRVELAAQAIASGINPTVELRFSKKEIFDRYTYKRKKVRPRWYQHTFILKGRPK
jgi:hypothetical protein